jgi:hypothetical protein
VYAVNEQQLDGLADELLLEGKVALEPECLLAKL